MHALPSQLNPGAEPMEQITWLGSWLQMLCNLLAFPHRGGSQVTMDTLVIGPVDKVQVCNYDDKRREITIYNTDAVNTVYVGNAPTITGGQGGSAVSIPPGAARTFPTTHELYCRNPSAANVTIDYVATGD